MPKEKLPGRSPPKQEAAEQSKARVRIGRACDRCKLKKSKCDGNSPCSGCISSESLCEYSARRRRETRDWYWEMREIIDEALQSLYWACREGRGFPGTIPDESNGHVSTDAILRGLGFIPPAVERTTGVGVASNAFSDDAESAPERSYHPPDVPSDRRSVNKPVVARIPLGGRPGNLAVEDGIGRQGSEQHGSRRVLPNTPNHDPVSVDLDPQFGIALDNDIDPIMFHDDQVGILSIDTTEPPGAGPSNLQRTTPMKRGHGYRPIGLDHADGDSSAGEDNVVLNSGDPGWQNEGGPKSSEVLPWPGSLAALSHKPMPDDGTFNSR